MAMVSPTKLAKRASCLANCEQLRHGCKLFAFSEMSFVCKQTISVLPMNLPSPVNKKMPQARFRECNGNVFIFGIRLKNKKEQQKKKKHVFIVLPNGMRESGGTFQVVLW